MPNRKYLITVSKVVPTHYEWALADNTATLEFVEAIDNYIPNYFVIDEDNYADYFATLPIFIKIDSYDLLVIPPTLLEIAADLVIYNADRFGGIRSAALL